MTVVQIDVHAQRREHLVKDDVIHLFAVVGITAAVTQIDKLVHGHVIPLREAVTGEGQLTVNGIEFFGIGDAVRAAGFILFICKITHVCPGIGDFRGKYPEWCDIPAYPERHVLVIRRRQYAAEQRGVVAHPPGKTPCTEFRAFGFVIV